MQFCVYFILVYNNEVELVLLRWRSHFPSSSQGQFINFKEMYLIFNNWIPRITFK